LSGSKTAELDQGMFGQALDEFFTRISACSKNRDFCFLHDMAVALSPEDISVVYLLPGQGKIQNAKLKF
jgi:hypothetical protein